MIIHCSRYLLYMDADDSGACLAIDLNSVSEAKGRAERGGHVGIFFFFMGATDLTTRQVSPTEPRWNC